MRIQQKLILGTLFFVLTLALSIPLTSPTAYALEAKTEAELNTLAGTLKIEDGNTISGTLNGTKITFKKKAVSSLSTQATYEATNLDCNGEKATISPNNAAPGINGVEPGVFLRAKHAQGSGCSSQKEIKLSLTTQEFNNAATNGAAAAGEEPDSCETTNSGPLGWILCPIIDLGATTTTFMFDNFVKPFLEDVPVSTDPDTGVYKAWEQFRTIGNIVLVGTMIAVVYAQIKGDR